MSVQERSAGVLVLVLNLDTEIDRYRRIAAQVPVHPRITVQRVRGLPGGAVPNIVCETLTGTKDYGVHVGRGALGCLLAHVNAWEIIADADVEFAFIAEDDVFWEDSDRLISLVLPADADVVFCNDRMAPLEETEATIFRPLEDGVARIVATKAESVGGDGYILTPAAARRLLAAVREDFYYGVPNWRLLRYCISRETLAQNFGGSGAEQKLILERRFSGSEPEWGILKAYVLSRPLVRHGTAPSSRKREDHAAALDTRCEQLRSSNDPLGQLEDSRRQIAALTVRLAEAESQRALLYQTIENSRRKLGLVLASHSWGLTLPLRLAMRMARGDWNAILVGLRGALSRLAPPIYQKLPDPLKRQVASLADRLAAPLFKGHDDYQAWRTREFLPRLLKDIVLPSSERPLVSIVIPTYGDVRLVALCLQSIVRNAPQVPLEVIVIEDQSGDPEIDQLASVRGLRYEVNPYNLGFTRSCNRAASFVRGEYIHFLNNDTRVCPGWLDALLKIFQKWSGVGLVGSALVYPDGRLQEAGGVIWRDASGSNFGRDQDYSAPAYNYTRETDYCSGAALLIRADLFAKLGCFDERYAPAYYEDTDLAFKVRQSGLKVVYQPRSTVVHIEGASHGTNVAGGIKSYQLINQRKFRERWKAELDRFHFPNGEELFLARDRSREKRCILVIDRYVPRPDQDAGSRSVFNIIESLVEQGFNVKFWPQDLWRAPDYTERLQELGVEVFYGPEYWNNFGSWVAVNGHYLHCALLSRPNVAIDFIEPLRLHSDARLLFYGHDIHHLRMFEQASVHSADAAFKNEAVKMEELERRVWSMVDVVYYPSDAETAYVRANSRVPVRTIPLWGFREFAPEEDDHLSSRRDIMFVAGWGHAPNEDGALWFVKEILPAIRWRVPAVRLGLIGAYPTAKVRALAADPQVTVTDYVTDQQLAAHYSSARVAIAPLRFGAGMKGKVVEAMRFGVPIVTTPFGTQGMADVAGELPVHFDPEGFAEAVIALLTDDALWCKQRGIQGRYVRSRFSMQALREFLSADINDPMQQAVRTGQN